MPTAILLPEDGFVDDEMFLDEDESYERSRNNSIQNSIKNNTRGWQQGRSTRGGAHFVYKGPNRSNDSHSDFRKILISLFAFTYNIFFSTIYDENF